MEVTLGNIMIDCEDEEKLCSFYHELLGWKRITRYGRVGVISDEGLVLLFITEKDYIRPVWPEEDTKQQKQIHFDFQVDDLNQAVTKAEKLGACKTSKQYGKDLWVTLIDPSGHLFCLCKKIIRRTN